MVNGKQKGASFERRICVALSIWVSGGKSEDLFWRAAMSGGRSTVAFRKGKTLGAHAGDISATAPEGHALTDEVMVECKAYRDLKIRSAIYTSKGELADFWRVAWAESHKYGKRPMLIGKENGCPLFVCLVRQDARLFELKPLAIIRCIGAPRMFMFSFDALLSQPFPFGTKNAKHPSNRSASDKSSQRRI